MSKTTDFLRDFQNGKPTALLAVALRDGVHESVIIKRKALPRPSDFDPYARLRELVKLFPAEAADLFRDYGYPTNYDLAELKEWRRRVEAE